MPKKSPDIRVFDMRITLMSIPEVWRLLAVSADAMLPEFYRTVQGAFDWVFPMYPELYVADKHYEGGVGSRTTLRRVFEADALASLTLVGQHEYLLRVHVERSYVVPSRRHFPKVLDGAGMIDSSFGRDTFYTDSSTWRAQGLARYGYHDLADRLPVESSKRSQSAERARRLIAL